MSNSAVRIPGQYTRYNTQNTVHNIQYTIYSTQDIVHKIQYTSYSIQDTVHKVQYTRYSTQDTVYKIQYTKYSIQDTKPSVSRCPTLTRPGEPGSCCDGEDDTNIKVQMKTTLILK